MICKREEINRQRLKTLAVYGTDAKFDNLS